MHQKLVSDPFLILVNNPEQSLHQKILLKVRCFDLGYQKAFRKLTLFFLLSPIPFNGKSYKKQKGPETNGHSLLGYKTSSENSFIS